MERGDKMKKTISILCLTIALSISFMGCTSQAANDKVEAIQIDTTSETISTDVESEDITSATIEEKIKFYFGIDVSNGWEQPQIPENPDAQPSTEKNYIFIKDGKSGIVCLREDENGELFSAFTDVELGSLADNSEKKQKAAALQYLIDKHIIENKNDVTFEEIDKQKGFKNYIFNSNDDTDYLVGVSDRNTEVVSIVIIKEGVK
jgi:hypothetical protein